jgi:hypothetical protein
MEDGELDKTGYRSMESGRTTKYGMIHSYRRLVSMRMSLGKVVATIMKNTMFSNWISTWMWD